MRGHSPVVVRCQIPARGVTSSNMDDGKERRTTKNKKKGKAVTTLLEQLDLRRRDELFTWLGQ